MSFILDTDHCIAILRGHLDIRSKIDSTTPLFITAITVSELIYGAYKSQRPEHHLAQVELLIESVTVLPFDTSAGRRCGALKDSLRRTGNLIAEPDLQIASITLENLLPLVTHNQKHFDRIPRLELVDWL